MHARYTPLIYVYEESWLDEIIEEYLAQLSYENEYYYCFR